MDFEPWKNHPQSDSEYLQRPEAQPHLKVMEVLREWDPIGVDPNNTPGAFDEYDSYAGPIVSFLDQGVDIDVMLNYLRRIVHDHMGLTNFEENKTRQLLRELIAWWAEWNNHQLDQN
ncbi:MAG: hypothetical protein KTR15_15000 [Phycisphaeraceae bacterium]|nr:hypothetical protein [Phycisphaeraceae bacterium]